MCRLAWRNIDGLCVYVSTSPDPFVPVDPTAPRFVAFDFLSWNLAMLAPSVQAPSGWDIDYTEDAIRRFVLRQAPHWVFFQETPPNLIPFVEGYALAPQLTESHSGNIVTLIREELAEMPIGHTVVDGCAVLTTLLGLDFTVANVHLAPSKSGGHQRLAMLEQILDACSTRNLLVIGDTNTRVTEEAAIGELALTGERPPSPTWDSRANRFRSKNRAFTAFFTRYFARGDATVAELKVWNKPLIVDDSQFFLSDHFALSGKISVPLN